MQTASVLHSILNPACVAIIGASDDQGKFGGRATRFIQKHHFGGRIVLINPKRSEILGLNAYPNLAAAPGPIDVALLAVPSDGISATLRECAEVGVKGAVIITADFAEVGEEGRARQDELVALARSLNIRIIGPNCLGFVNPHANLALTSSVAMAVDSLPKGAIGLVAQSGSIMASLVSHASDDGGGFSLCATIGNQADLEACDFVDYLVEDPNTKVICLYLEGLQNGEAFIRVARRARAAGKPLLIVKSGRTAAGAAVTKSHTASLAGSFEVFEATCRDEGVCLLDDPEDMIKFAEFLSVYQPTTGDGVGALTPSGGGAAIAGDRISSSGLRLSGLSPATRQYIAQTYPSNRAVNPLDFGGMPLHMGMEVTTKPLEMFIADDDVAVVFPIVTTSPNLPVKATLWAKIAKTSKKPVVFIVTPGTVLDPVRQIFRDIGVPYCNSMNQAIQVTRACITYGQFAARARDDAPGAACPEEAAAYFAALPAGYVAEPKAKQLLKEAGVRVTGEALARTAEEAIAAARSMNAPVALKIVSDQIPHKTDIGGVRLNLTGDDDIRRAWGEIMQAARTSNPNATLDGCLVQEMVSGIAELIIGAKWDPLFGAVVLVGTGGIFVEILRDVQMARAPITHSRALALLKSLRCWPLLQGARGLPKADIDAVADTLVKVGALAARLGPSMTELDINPLFVRAAGQGAVAVDARATKAGGTDE